MKITLAQIEIIPGRPDCNFRSIENAVAQAKADGSGLIIFPELALSGYLVGDLWEQSAFLRDCEHYGERVRQLAQDICIIFGNVAMDWNKIGDDGRVRKYNACFVACNGEFAGADNFIYPFRIKSLLPNYREFEESRHFYCTRKLALETGLHPSRLIQPVNITVAGRSLRLGCMICEDGWDENYALKPVELLCQSGCGLLVNISCSPYTFGKNDKRHRIFSSHAAAHDVPLIYLNATGLQNNGKTVYSFDGSSAVYDNRGAVRLLAPSFCDSLITFEPSGLTAAAEVACPADDIASIFRCLQYSVGKFLKSIKLERVVIGASGGIDSAVAAALYCRILGADNVLLVNMPGAFNSQTTKSLAYQLAVNLGCLYTSIPVQESAEHTRNQLLSIPVQSLRDGSSFFLEPSSFVFENIQARDRSARILAAVAASWNAGFTCNANKAETTVGYSTLYGDHAGFLAALADLWKHQVYALAEYINKDVYGFDAIPRGSIDIVPSAELSAAQNVDEGKGDPIIYPYHDYLFRSFIEHWQRATPEDLLEKYLDGSLEQYLGCRAGIVSENFPTAQEFISDLERWWRQFSGMGLAKRIQAPPVIAISRRAYGFDLRESQCGVYYTAKYQELREKALCSR